MSVRRRLERLEERVQPVPESGRWPPWWTEEQHRVREAMFDDLWQQLYEEYGIERPTEEVSQREVFARSHEHIAEYRRDREAKHE